MGLIDLASGDSIWRGIDYYDEKRVISWKKLGSDTYSGIVSGNGAEPYIVYINKQHPRKSTCNCPFANGRRVICKHMLALLFTIEPETVQNFLNEVEKYEAEEKKRKQLHYDELKTYVKSLSKSELQEQLLNALVQLEEKQEYY